MDNKTIYFSGCCRIGGLATYGAGSGFNVNTIINIGSGNRSPVQSIPPIVNLPQNSVAAFSVAAFEPGTNLSFTAQASDPDPNDSVRIIEAKHKVTGLDFLTSMGATFAMPTSWENPTSSMFNLTPVLSQWGHQHVIFKADDSDGDNVTHEISILVNTTPMFTSSPVLTATVRVPYSHYYCT